MNHKSLLLTFLVVGAFMVGCEKADSTSQRLDKLKTETKEAAQDLNDQDYAYAQKGEFTDKMHRQLAEINQELELLGAKIEKSSATAQAEARPKLAALRVKADELGKQLEKAKDATESTWDSVKAGSKKAYGELKEGFTQARKWVSEKIAP